MRQRARETLIRRWCRRFRVSFRFGDGRITIDLPERPAGAHLPLLTALGPTLRLTVGVGDLTEIVADCTAVPQRPEQVSV